MARELRNEIGQEKERATPERSVTRSAAAKSRDAGARRYR